MRSWWRHEQASVRMAVTTAGHRSCRKATGIEIGVQAGTPCFTNLTWSGTTNPGDLDALAPVTEYVAPALAVVCDEPAPVFEYAAPAPVIECVAPAPDVTFVVPSLQLPPVYTTTTVTTDDNLDMISLVYPQFSSTAVEPYAPRVVDSLLLLEEFTEPEYKSTRSRLLQVRCLRTLRKSLLCKNR